MKNKISKITQMTHHDTTTRTLKHISNKKQAGPLRKKRIQKGFSFEENLSEVAF